MLLYEDYSFIHPPMPIARYSFIFIQLSDRTEALLYNEDNTICSSIYCNNCLNIHVHIF